MASQRMMVACLAGLSAEAVAASFARWRTVADPSALDRFCEALRDNAAAPALACFTEWIDHWSMGDEVPGPGAVEGRRFSAACLAPAEAAAWADDIPRRHPEQGWLAAGLREAVAAGSGVAVQRAVVVVREVIGPSVSDGEIEAAMRMVPPWLASLLG